MINNPLSHVNIVWACLHFHLWIR